MIFIQTRTTIAGLAACLLATFFYLGCSTSTLTTNPTPVKCQVAVPGPAQPLAAAGGSTMLAVSAPPECAWSANADASWVAELKPSAGQGDGRVEVIVSANATASSRQTSVRINDLVVAITQDGTPCQFTVTGPSSAGASGGALTYNVNTIAGCAWTASSSAAWLAPPASASGNGPGSVVFTAAANTGAARSGSITVAGQALTLSQPAGSDCLSVAPLSATVAAAGGPTTITISANGACQWSASSPVPWITVSPDSGVGGGTLTLTVASNSGAARSATVAVAGQTVTVAQRSLTCSYAINPSSFSTASGGDNSSLALTTSSSCTWSAVPDVPWITVTSGATGTGNGSVAFSVAANPSGARSGTIRVADQTFNVAQAAAPPAPPNPPPVTCSFTLGGSSQTVSSTAGAGTPVTVTTTSACAWTAASGAPWIAITSGASTTGSGSVAFTVAANTGAQRSGTMTIAGQTHTVTQAAAPATPPPSCVYAINPSSQNIASAGGTGAAIAVTTTSACAWTAVSNAPWLTITSGAGGSGNGTVAFTVGANTGTARSGTLTVAGRTFAVDQAAAPPPPPSCTFNINPTSASLLALGGAGPTVNVTTTSACAWTAVSNAAWLTINTGAARTGNGTVTFTAAPNLGSSRTGTLTIAGETFTVNQGALLCSYSINPTATSFNRNAQTGRTVAVTATALCPWTAVSHDPWITITNGAAGLGNGTVTYSLTANTTNVDRTGTITVATHTFTIEQRR